MTLTQYTIRPSVRATLRTFFIHHNPFYLLSALCMLAGCYALNSGLGVHTGELGKLLGLIGALNAYEAILIGLGLYLIHKRRIIRDGRTLLLLESAFLVDLAFLNAQAGSVSFRTGIVISLCVIALTTLKVGVVVRVLWGRLPNKLLGMILLELYTLVLMPTVFTWFDHHGGVTWKQCYAWWWAAGGLVAFLGISQSAFENDAVPVRRAMRTIYIVLPLASLVAHLSMLHWVYRAPFGIANLSPLLLGLAVFWSRSPIRFMPRIRAIRMASPLAALLLATQSPYGEIWSGLGITPAQITIGGTYATIAFCFFGTWFGPVLASGAVLGMMVLFGPSFEEIWMVVAEGWRRVTSVLGALIPKTAMEWGIVAITSSFAFLAMGAAVSLKKERLPDPVDAE